MVLGGKHAKELGYEKYVGEEINVTGKLYGNSLVEVTMSVKDVPFPVSLAVHKDDIIYVTTDNK